MVIIDSATVRSVGVYGYHQSSRLARLASTRTKRGRVSSPSACGLDVMPYPDSPTPLHGAEAMAPVNAWLFTVTTPARSLRAIASPRDTSRVQMLAVSPKRDSLARRIASSALVTTTMGSTGPKVSSRINGVSSPASLRTVGACVSVASSWVPPVTSWAPSVMARATCPRTMSSCARVVMRPTSIPGRSSATSSATRFTNGSAIALSTYTRSIDAQFCPALVMAPHTTPRAARSTLASARTIAASFPPSSREQGISRPAHVCAMPRPVATLPVKTTKSTSAFTSSLPASPAPWTNDRTP